MRKKGRRKEVKGDGEKRKRRGRRRKLNLDKWGKKGRVRDGMGREELLFALVKIDSCTRYGPECVTDKELVDLKS